MDHARKLIGSLVGLSLLGLLFLALNSAFQGQSTANAPTFSALAATPTNTPRPLVSLDNIQVARQYPLQVASNILEENPWNMYGVPSFSPDGTMALFRKTLPAQWDANCKARGCGVYLGELWRTNAQGNSATLLAKRVNSFAWSPDSQWIAYDQFTTAGNASLWVMKADGSGKKLVANDIVSAFMGWLDTKTIVYIPSNRSIMSVTSDGTITKQLSPPFNPAHASWMFGLSPKGNRMAFIDDHGGWLVSLGDNAKPVKLDPYDGAFGGSTTGGIVWSPTGDRVAMVTSQEIYIFDPDGNQIGHMSKPWDWSPYDLAWSPDGRILASLGRSSDHGPDFEIYLTDAKGTKVKQLTNTPGYKYTLTWSPDGTKLYYGTEGMSDQKIQVLELTPNSALVPAKTPGTTRSTTSISALSPTPTPHL